MDIRRYDTSIANRVFDAFLYLLLTLLCITIIYPFLHLLALSFNQGIDAIRGGIGIWPRAFTTENYALVFQDQGLISAVGMTVLRTVVGTTVEVILTAGVAYCFTKSLVGYKFYMALYLIPMYWGAGIIPTYLVYREMGILNSFWIYILPNLAFGYNIIVMRTNFKSIPPALEESAEIDGASVLRIFLQIIIPLSGPVLATIALFAAVFQWNSWFDTLMYTRSDSLETLSSLLAQMLMEQQSSYVGSAIVTKRANHLTPEVLRAAMTIITTVPILFVYPFVQRFLISGVMVGSVKE